MNKKIKIGVGFLITFIFTYLTLSQLKFNLLIGQINIINPHLIIMTIIFIFVDYLIKSYRWWLLTSYQSIKVSFWITIRYYFIGNFLNNILPMRAGDAYRVISYANISGIKTGAVLACVAVERIFDLLTLLILLWLGMGNVFGISVFNNYSDQVQDGIFKITITTITIISIIIILPNINYKKNNEFLPKFIYLFIYDTFNALKSILNFKRIFYILSLSLVSWTIEAFAYGIILKSLSLELPINAMFLSSSFATISTLLPSSPGYIGTFHYFCMISLTPFRVNEQTAILFAFIMHFILWTSITTFGILSYILQNFKFIYRSMR